MPGGIEWLSPGLLAGAAAAALPILIHLIHRRPAPPRPFAPIMLLERAQSRQRFSPRFKHWLLMLIRAALVGLLAFAFARPYLVAREPGAAVSPEAPPTAVVFVLDDTLSMRQSADGRTSAFDRARARLDRLVRSVRSFDQSAILSVSGAAPWESARLSDGSQDVRDRARDAGPGFGGAGVWPALSRAAAALRSSPLPARRIIVLSDLAATSWQPADEAVIESIAAQGIGLQILDCRADAGAGRALANSAVTAVRVSSGPEGPVVDVTCRGFALAAPRTTACALHGEGTGRPTQTVTLTASGETTVRFPLAPSERTRWLAGTAVLEADALVADDVRYFAVRRSGPLKVLLVDGEPSETLYLTETFYLARALSPARAAEDIVTTIATVRQFETLDPSAYDCVILANVPPLEAQTAARLTRAVESGGGLVILAGSRTAPRDPVMSRLLPAALRAVQESGPGEAALGLKIGDPSSPVTAVLGPQWRLSLSQAEVRRFWQADALPGSTTVLDLSNGLPALVEGACGRGRTFLSTFPWDRDWSDFCIHPTFVPILHALVRYAGRARGAAEAAECVVGRPLRFKIPETDAPAVAKAAREGGRPAAVAQVAGHPGEFVFTDTAVPGRYTLSDDQGGILAEGVVNVDTAESDLSAVEPEDILKRVRPGAGESRGPSDARSRTPLWPLALWAALALLALEALYSRR